MSNPFDQFDALSRGERNNNPLNLTGNSWQGQTGTDGRFAQFDTPEAGRAAAEANLIAYNRKHGLNTVEGIVGRWAPPSENDTGAYAKFVADKMGVDPKAPIDVNDPLTRGRLLDAMQQQETGKAPSNAFDQFDAQTAPQQPVVTVEAPGHPETRAAAYKHPPQAIPQRPAAPPQKVSQSLGFLKGVTDPIMNIDRMLNMPMTGDQAMPALAAGRKLMGYLSPLGLARLAIPQVQAAQQGAVQAAAANNTRPGKIGQFAGNVASLAAIPGGPIVNGAASGLALSKASTPLGIARDLVVGAAAGKVADMAVKGVGSMVSNLLSKSPKVLTPGEIGAARDAAYKAVDNIGVQYTPQSMDDLVQGMTDEMTAAKINPLRHPKAASMLDEVQSLKGTSPSLTDLDQLRQVIRRDVASASDPAEAFFGQKMIKNLDEFINAAGPDQVVAGDAVKAADAIKTARALNTQLRKIDAVQEAVDTAQRRAASTGSGGNADNAIRQNVRRVFENSKNLTPEEQAAMEKVIRGAPGQNIARQVGKLSPQSSGLMTALGIGGTMANPVLGIPSLIGAVSKGVADRATQGNVDKLIELMAAGGVKGAAARVPTAASRAVDAAIPQLSPAASAAGAALAVPLLTPAAKRKQKRR